MIPLQSLRPTKPLPTSGFLSSSLSLASILAVLFLSFAVFFVRSRTKARRALEEVYSREGERRLLLGVTRARKPQRIFFEWQNTPRVYIAGELESFPFLPLPPPLPFADLCTPLSSHPFQLLLSSSSSSTSSVSSGGEGSRVGRTRKQRSTQRLASDRPSCLGRQLIPSLLAPQVSLPQLSQSKSSRNPSSG